MQDSQCMTKTCPCGCKAIIKVVKNYIFSIFYIYIFLFFPQNIDCGYLTDAVLTNTHNLCFRAKIGIPLCFTILYILYKIGVQGYIRTLHGHVFLTVFSRLFIPEGTRDHKPNPRDPHNSNNLGRTLSPDTQLLHSN